MGDAVTEAIGLQDLILGTMASAAVVLMGAFYALFFALGRLHASPSFAAASIVSYALLAAAVYVLVQALTLDGIWITVVAVMLVGYFLLPRAIWRLCVGTHGESEPQLSNGASR